MVEIEGVEYWTVEEVAAHCGVTPATIRSYAARGQAGLPAPVTVGRTPIWRAADIRDWHAARPSQRDG